MPPKPFRYRLSGGKYIIPACRRAGKVTLEKQTNLIAVAIGVVLAVVVLFQILTRRTWVGQHLRLSLHLSSPRPGTVHRMARGLRLSTR